MSSCVLIDFNNLCYRLLFTKDVGLGMMQHGAVPDFKLWRYMVLDAIYQLMLKFDVSEIILAIDDKNSWRRSFFPRYKESRKVKRDKQEDINWEMVFGMMTKFQGELKHHFPFKVLKIKSAEADDIIGTIALYRTDLRDVIISSNDEDFLQLSSNRVKIWNPSKKEFSVCENTDEFLVSKCLMGQAKDDIFNVLTPNDWGQTEKTIGVRKPGLGPVAVKKILNEGLENWFKKNVGKKLDVDVDPKENFKRNQILIDFTRIPDTIKGRILDAYENYSFPPPANIFPFIKSHGMRGFIDDYTRFENHVMKLY
jgi:5'-3' exonuclease